MSSTAHKIYIFTLSAIVAVVFLYLSFNGYSYYKLPVDLRYDHPDHNKFKPSGIFGHGLGIAGTLLMVIGVFGYIARKKSKFLAQFGRLKYWLEFHIFLCSLGPTLVLFHTAFKFGGIVSISFWSMVAVVLSGVIGRFIYIQIPRTIEGRELSLNEVKAMKGDLENTLKNTYNLDENARALTHAAMVAPEISGSNFFSRMVNKFFADRKTLSQLRKNLKNVNLQTDNVRQITRLVSNEISLNNRIERLLLMQKLFRYWHVAHLPFAVIMTIFLAIHVAVTLAFGYKWVF